METVLPKKFQTIYPFKGRILQITGGYKINYLDEGKGEPIIMVHGNPTWSFFYRNLVLGLRSNYRCIVPDHLGCGLSDKPKHYSYTLDNHIENLSKLVKKLNLNSFHLIVHDWGGPIGIGMAQKFPDQLKRIIVLNTSAFVTGHIPLRISLCKKPILGPLFIRGMNGFARGAIRMAVEKPLSSLVRKGYLFPYNSWGNRIGILKFVQDIPLSNNNRSWNTLKGIEQGLSMLNDKPMLICWGAKDFCFNDVYLKEWLRRFPDAQLCRYPQAGHYLLEDAGDEILEDIEDFLEMPMCQINDRKAI